MHSNFIHFSLASFFMLILVLIALHTNITSKQNSDKETFSEIVLGFSLFFWIVFSVGAIFNF